MSPECIGDATIAAYVDGALDRVEIGRVDRHIDSCPSCREQLSAVVSSPVLHSFVTEVAADAPTEVAPERTPVARPGGGGPVPGSALGRYVVESVIGRGGMGVVVRAHDPELDRSVAIKLVEPGLGASGGSSAGGAWRARLRAEARAMARLRHPNVVSVHDVGTVGDQLFVAMELVDGASLSRWRTGKRKREILAACIAAGRGLAAAHAADLVHGDVKPDNILVDRDGRALIGDFGLAQAMSDDRGLGDHAPGERHVGGTPPYMAPELYRGEPPDPRSDQFAFAVTLYEVLVGERPYRGDSLATVQAAIEAGVPPRPPRLPSWLWAAIARGLAADPAARHPSIAAMLDQLVRDAARRRRRVLVATGAAVVVAGGATALALAMGTPAAACADPAARVAPLATAVAALCNGASDPTCAAATAGLQRWLGDWRTTHVAVCTATRDGGQSSVLLDARMRCLDHRLVEHAALVERLGPGPLAGAAAQDAISAVATEDPPRECATIDRTGGLVPPPEKAKAIAEAERWVATANADYALGHYQTGLDAFAPHAPAIAALAHPPLDAAAAAILGQLQREVGALADAEHTFDTGLKAAAVAQDDVLSAKLMLDLAYLVGESRQDPTRGAELLRAASVAIVRAGNLPALESIYLLDRAGFADQRGELAAAIADYTRAIELRRKSVGPDASETAIALQRLCDVEAESNKLADARAHCEEAVAILRRKLGADHPIVAAAENELAVTYAIEGDLATARQHWEAVLASLERSLGPDASGLGPVLLNLGDVARMTGDADAAQQYLDRAIAISGIDPDKAENLPVRLRVADQLSASGKVDDAIAMLEDVTRRGEAKLGANHPTVADATARLAQAYYMADRLADARTTYEHAIEIHRAVYGERNPATLTLEGQYGQTLIAVKAVTAAQPVLERVMLALEATVEPDSPYLAQAYQNYADCQLELGDAARAADLAEKALAIWDKRGDNPLQRAETHFMLGQALWRANRDRARAVTLVKTARDEMKAIGPEAISLARVERWIKGDR